MTDINDLINEVYGKVQSDEDEEDRQRIEKVIEKSEGDLGKPIDPEMRALAHEVLAGHDKKLQERVLEDIDAAHSVAESVYKENEFDNLEGVEEMIEALNELIGEETREYLRQTAARAFLAASFISVASDKLGTGKNAEKIAMDVMMQFTQAAEAVNKLGLFFESAAAGVKRIREMKEARGETSDE